MEKGKEMLADPEKKVSDISMMAGYENPRYFSKVFKQFTGMTPSEYREALNRQKDKKCGLLVSKDNRSAKNQACCLFYFPDQ